MSFNTRNTNRSYVSTRSYRAPKEEQRWRRNQNTVAYTAAAKLGPIAHTVIIALMIAVLGLIYLTQVTKTSFFGYQLNERETQLETLATERQNLEIENARLQALERVRSSDVAKAMTTPVSTEYTN